MILFKNRLVFGIIKKVITSIFKVVYSFLSMFNLQLTLLIGCIGLVLYVTGVFDKKPAVLILFCAALVISVILAVALTVRKLLGIGGKRWGKTKKGAEEQTPAPSEPAPPVIQYIQVPVQTVAPQPQVVQAVPPAAPEAPASADKGKVNGVYPKYFTVKQNKDYIMAEYEDRYELLFKDKNGLKKIRTDYKNGENL